MTSIAAAWLNIVYGFGGLRSDRKILSIAPTLPKKWKSYTFNLTINDNFMKFKVDKEKLSILNEGSDTKIKVYGHLKNIKRGVNIFKR